MAKGLSIMSIVIAILLFLLFALDLFFKFPFRRASLLMDIVFVICALLLGLVSWNAYREIR